MTGRARAGRAPPPQIYAMRRQEKAAKDVSHIETNAASMHKTPEEAAQDAAAESRAGDASKKPTESTAPSSSATAPTVNSKAPSVRFVRLSVYLCVSVCARARSRAKYVSLMQLPVHRKPKPHLSVCVS